MAQPSSLAGTSDAVPMIVTGRMNESSNDVLADASTELTVPANSTAKATTAIEATASQTGFDSSVPRHTKTAPTTASQDCAWRRSRSGPLKSTSISMANEPNAEKIATSAFRRTTLPKANSTGITMAVRPARRSAANPGSCRVYQLVSRTCRLPARRNPGMHGRPHAEE